MTGRTFMAGLKTRPIPSHALTYYSVDQGPALIIPARPENLTRPAYIRHPKATGFRKLHVVSWEGEDLKLRYPGLSDTLIVKRSMGTLTYGDYCLQKRHCPNYVNWERDQLPWTLINSGVTYQSDPENPSKDKIVLVLSDSDKWEVDRDLIVLSGTRDELTIDYVNDVDFRRNKKEEDAEEGITDRCTLSGRWKIKTPAGKISFSMDQIGREMWYNGERIPAFAFDYAWRIENVPGKDMTVRIAA